MESPRKWLVLVVAGAIAIGCRGVKDEPSIARAVASETITVPDLAAGDPVPKDATVITASATRVTILGDRHPIASVPPDAGEGLAAIDVRDGLFVPSLEEALVWSASETRDGGRSLAVVFAGDAGVPYRVVVELLASAPDDAEIYLAGRQGGGAGLLALPLARKRVAIRRGLASPTIWIERDAIRIHSESALPEPCAGSMDEGTLTPCLALLVKTTRDFAAVGAGPGVRYDAVVRVLSLARASGWTELALASRGPS